MRSVMTLCIAFLCCALLLISGCANSQFRGFFSQEPTVTVFSKEEFSRFLTGIGPERVKHNLVNPIISEKSSVGEYQPESYGEELYSRLSMRFMWPAEERKRTAEHVTHADIPSAEEALHISKYALDVVGEFGTDSYVIVALLDWNNDGKRDWLVRYNYTPALGSDNTVRFIVIPSPSTQGIMDAQIVFMEECAYGKCRAYSGRQLSTHIGYIN